MRLSRFIRLLAATALAAGLTGCTWLLTKHPDAKCKLRGQALNERAHNLENDAREQLTVGTSKDAVIRFFEAHGLNAYFSPPVGGVLYAKAAMRVTGCSPTGCGSDGALFGLEVPVDEHGAVAGKPIVLGGMYTDCL